MDVVFLGALFGSLLIVLLIALLAVRGLKSSGTDEEESPRVNLGSRPGVSNLPPGIRHRARARHQPATRDEEDEEDDPQFEEGQDLDEDFSLKGKIGVKKQRKLEMKAEKKAARERELQEREERKKMLEEKERQRKIQEEKQEAEEKAKEEAERMEKERKEKEEYEMYLKLKESFTVDEEGYDGDANEDESQSKLQAFIDYIKSHKVVHMDELAGHFNLKTQEVIQRIQDLLQQELLVGVIDDRGKFIYITNDELHSVAKFIRQRGRVSITDLAENSNTFINLIPAAD